MENVLEPERVITGDHEGREGGTWRGTLGTVSTFSVPEQGQTLDKHWERLAAFEIVGR